MWGNENNIKIALSSETPIDLSKELLEKYQINVVAFNTQFGDVSKLDTEVVFQDIIDFVDKSNGKVMPKTSAINMFQYEEHFNKLLQNHDAVIHLCLSSGASCTYNNARLVAEDNPKLFVIDTKSFSGAMALLAIYARELIDKKLPIEEIVRLVQEKTKKAHSGLMLSDLTYLQRGGRIGSLKLLLSKVLKMNVEIVVNENGVIDMGKKYRGDYKTCLLEYVNNLFAKFPKPDLKNVFINYSTKDDSVLTLIKNALKKIGFKNIWAMPTSPTISIHCGPNAVGVLFIEE